MSRSTTPEQPEQSNGTYSVNETPNKNSTETIHRHRIENTPFDVIGNEERGYFLAFGKYRITQPKPTIEETEKQLQENMWPIICDVMTIIATLESTKPEHKTQLELDLKTNDK
jgi:hypothetical protein